MSRILYCALATALLLSACAPVQNAGTLPDTAAVAHAMQVDSAQLMRDLSVLAADSMEGRRTGTPGNAQARAYLLERFRELGLTPFGAGYEKEFSAALGEGATARGVNLVGYMRGTEHPERYLVVTAHYDHLGVRNGQIYNGADDNASGTAALLAIAARLRAEPPRHSVIFVATDAEEIGLQGARAFVAGPPVPLERILVNVNMDMISRSDRGELFAAGTYHTPALRSFVERTAAGAGVRLLMGHDHPDLPPRDDWTMLSDHGAFHEAGIPFLYFGVADHDDYHRPTDVVENIQPGFYVRAATTVLDFVRDLDRGLGGQRPAAAAQARASSSSRAPSFAVLPSGS